MAHCARFKTSTSESAMFAARDYSSALSSCGIGITDAGPQEAAAVVNHMRGLGVLTATDGPIATSSRFAGRWFVGDGRDAIVEALDLALSRV